MRSRILMAPVDSGGASPATSIDAATPSEPQAQGDATDPAAALAAAEKRGRDAAFAELRRNGALKKSALQALDGTTRAPAQAAASESFDLRHLDRAVARTGFGSNLSDAAYRRMERAFADEKPSDSAAWVTDYFEGLGVAKPATTSTPPVTTAAPLNARPGSDAGAPARSQTPLAEQDVLSWTETDVNTFVKTKGVHAFKSLMFDQLRANKTRVKLT